MDTKKKKGGREEEGEGTRERKTVEMYRTLLWKINEKQKRGKNKLEM